MDRTRLFEILVLLGTLQYKIESMTKENNMNTVNLNPSDQRLVIH